jgi:hypothetical protein
VKQNSLISSACGDIFDNIIYGGGEFLKWKSDVNLLVE